jgi:hypothetical protein
MRFMIVVVRFFSVKLYSMCFLAMSITVVCFFMVRILMTVVLSCRWC